MACVTMKTIITPFSLCLIALFAATVGRAQTSADSTNVRAPAGVLGHNYGEISFGLQDIQHVGPNFYDVTVAGNAAVLPRLDLGGAFSAGWIRGNIDGSASLLSGSATTYTLLGNVKPFLSTALGYEWTSVPGRSQDKWRWGAAVGVEVPVLNGVMSLTPRIAYGDDFRDGARSTDYWTFEAEGNAWLTRSTGLFASVSYTDVNRSRFDSWNGRFGLRMLF